ncbi:hypothetical protein HGRIS_000533 [Hohenbuehelia grisea]|uniref:RING-type domain-containing protein n=1 Tax=Hohenbuehelia grisea TaxID=104357 RepID=A0ABR3JRH6_9AGAR
MSSSMPPVTPQRIPRNALSHNSTPYTPLSSRSFTSTSSTLTTPNSVSYSAGTRPKKLSFASPSSPELSMLGNKSYNARVSDMTDNWRSRASNHGITVTPSKSFGEDPHYGDDEASDRTFSDANDSGFITAEEALLSPPSLGPQRRPRAFSQALPSTKRNFGASPVNVLQPTSPNVARTPARSTSRLQSASASKANFEAHGKMFSRQENHDSPLRTRSGIENAIMCTPPPNRARAQQLRLKGSFTDPAVMRRRPGYNTPASGRAHDVSSQSLFDIHEQDCEDDDVEHSFNQHDYEREMDELSDRSSQVYQDYDADSFDGDGQEQFLQAPFSQSHQNVYNTHSVDPTAHMRPGAFASYPGHALPYPGANMNIPAQTMAGIHNQFPIIDPMNPLLRGLSMDHLAAPSYTHYPSPHSFPTMSLPQGPTLMHHPHFFGQPHALNVQSTHTDNNLRNGGVNSGFETGVEKDFHTRHQGLHPQLISTSHTPSPAISSISLHEGSQPSPSIDTLSKSKPIDSVVATQCSVCFRSASVSLAILSPCAHPLCSACLTSALNIVGEKDMECAVCKQAVKSFELTSAMPDQSSAKSVAKHQPNEKHQAQQRNDSVDLDHEAHWSPQSDLEANRLPPLRSTPKKNRTSTADDYARGTSFFDPLFSSPGSVCSGRGSMPLGNAFEFGTFNLKTDTMPNAIFGEGMRASTPKGDRRSDGAGKAGKSERHGSPRPGDNVVLRIDNVPWDITPPVIAAWLEQPVVRVHVLLDRKGKTQSHAFIEVQSEDIARAILRGEATPSSAGSKRMRSSVLGRGRRARGVTVTRSGQEELMRALFPSWRGAFAGSRPSLAGLDNKQVIGTLESGLVTEAEISALLGLIKDPASHFLKVPCLPFFSVASLLSKFPTDVDSRVFWTMTTRDMLYDLTVFALRTLRDRIASTTDPKQSHLVESDKIILEQILDVASSCEAFTAQQLAKLPSVTETTTKVVQESNAEGPPCEFTATVAEACVVDEPVQAPSQEDASKEVVNEEDDSSGSKPLDGAETPSTGCQLNTPQALDDLAKEFGVGPELLQAIAQRLNQRT